MSRIIDLCIASKIMERIVYHNIPFVLPLISKDQYGLLQNRPCLTQLLASFSLIDDSIDSNTTTDVLYIDFKKAFDSIPHQKLLHKL